MKTRFALFASVLACAALALTACQQATPNAPEPSPIASAAPTPTVTYHDLMMEQLPSIARTETIQGGIALAAAYIEQHPRLFQEGGSELFAYLSMEECEYCESEQERAQQTIDEFGFQVGGEFRASASNADFAMDFEQFDEPTLVVNFEVYEAPYTFVNASGEVTRSGGDQHFAAAFALQVRDGLWRVRHFETRESEMTPWEDIPPEIREILEQG